MRRVFCLLMVLPVFGFFTFPLAAAEKMTFVLGWVPYGRDAGFFTALDKGFFKKAGLDVTITRGFGGQPNIERIGSGKAEFVFGDTGSLLFGRAKGLKLRQTAMVHSKAPYVLFTFKGLGVEKPKDLEGKIIATQAREAGHVVFPALMSINGVDEKKIKFLTVAAPNKLPSLLAGKADATMEFATSWPNYQMAAEKAGKTLLTHYYSDWGLDIYSAGLTTTDEIIAKKPALVRGFVEAAMRGVAYGVEHPKEAVGNFMRHFPEQNSRIAAGAWKITIGLLYDQGAEKDGIGYMTKKKMTYTRDLLTKYQKISVRVPVEDLYTNRFLPKLFPKRP
ncbi:MAG: ABC transporter substrate-binding protein [Nitrospinota bacterium]